MVRDRTLTLRAIALLAAGSAGIHQLRYAIADGPGANHALTAPDHAYLGTALPLVMIALVLSLAAALMRVARGTGSSRQRSFGALWIGAIVALAVIYGAQESIEGAGPFAGSGWLGFALAVPAGALIATALRGARAAETLAPPRAALHFLLLADAAHGGPPALRPGRLVSPSLGARAPPAASVV